LLDLYVVEVAEPDLVVVGEWMPVRVFRQENGRFVERTAEAGLTRSEGAWNSVSAADLNGDGRPDLVLGNLGTNAYVRASPTEPARMYVSDFARNEDRTRALVEGFNLHLAKPVEPSVLVRSVMDLASR
jgi:CheY-like chemotaxis protein